MNTRFINCQVCMTEGRLYTTEGNNPDWTDCGICPECSGERVIEVETLPIALGDLTAVPFVTDWEDVEQLTNVVPWCDACQLNHFQGQCDPDLDEQRLP